MVFTQDDLEIYQELHVKNQSKLLENEGVVAEIFLASVSCVSIKLISGFSLETGPSTVPGAGNGVFVAEGEVPLSSGECLRTEY